MRVDVRAGTDLGLRRPENQDHYAIWHPPGSTDGGDGILLVVADGMGGARGGEVASHLAVDTLLETWGSDGRDDATARLQHSLEEANRVVNDHGASNPELRGMGTTCTALYARDREAFIGHVGDSRAYLVRDGAIRQLTRDHSLVAQLVQIRQITAEQARTDRRRNVVTRSVGVGESVEVDAERVLDDLRPGDTLLLCTDGLHGLLEDAELLQHASGPDLEAACAGMIALARERGGHDNITLVLARFGPGGEPSTQRMDARPDSTTTGG